MKKILITGKNSYVGNSFAEWVSKYPEEYEVDKISLRDSSWKEKDFSCYDVVLHVAGIAHQKETKKNAKSYYVINRDLAVEVAKKAKNSGVGQFIFLSTMSVYGLDSGEIELDTPLEPKSNYGKSKLEAENTINKLTDGTFKVVVLRPPMIYGKGCKGNYQRLAMIARMSPIFPNIKNKRSMIYVDNLSEITRLIIKDKEQGLFFPQNQEFVRTSEMVRLISLYANNKNIAVNRLLNPVIRPFKKLNLIKKVFGDLVYGQEISKYRTDYQLFELEESIQQTERMDGKNNE
ncbi:NAD-dependent epimerase/dehydratase family protein [Oceanobacillus picturae]|uniref:NAD-dependent epimerase/dehydratase family protein n=1 Tax=Oceanobacillus picturae TaxID=171693 RepID=UPI00363A8D48